MERPYLNRWKQYLLEQDPNEAPSVAGSNAYYLMPGEEPEFSNASAKSGFDQFPWGDINYKGIFDIEGKPINLHTIPQWMNSSKALRPKVPTMWFTLYKGYGPENGQRLAAYHIQDGAVTDPTTGKTLMDLASPNAKPYGPGANRSAKDVYTYFLKHGDGSPFEISAGPANYKRSGIWPMGVKY